MLRRSFELCGRARSWLVCAAALAALTVIAFARASALAPARRVLVVRSEADPPGFTFQCPEDHCVEITLESFSCPVLPRPVEILVFTGHSVPPVYLHHAPERLAQVVACYQPALVVLDTCYGFSSPLLAAIARVRPSTLVVGATYKLPLEGLVYREALLGPGAIDERADAIQARSGARLERWRADEHALQAALDQVARWNVGELVAHLQRRLPNLVRVGLPGSTATALVPVPSSRFAP